MLVVAVVAVEQDPCHIPVDEGEERNSAVDRGDNLDSGSVADRSLAVAEEHCHKEEHCHNLVDHNLVDHNLVEERSHEDPVVVGCHNCQNLVEGCRN